MHENPKTHIPTVYLVVPCYNEEEVLPETEMCIRDREGRQQVQKI